MQLYTSGLRTIFLIFCFVFVGFSAFADVVVTMPTGGRNISNDKSSVGPNPTYTALGDIMIAETAPGDFTAGSNRTISFNRPAGWQFNTGVGTVIINGPNISNAAVSVSATSLIVSYTVTGSTNGDNSITISGIEVQSVTKTISPEILLTRSGGNGIIKGFDVGAAIAPLSKVPGSFVKLIALLPTETLNPGSITGKSSVATTIKNTGETVDVTINAVDYAWNLINTATDEIAITSNDTYAGLPTNANLVGGIKTFTVSLPTANAYRNITATSVTNPSILPANTTSFKVNIGPFSKLLMVLPGETFEPGSAMGKTGLPTAPVAGSNYRITIYAVDDYWNKVSITDNVSVSTSGVSNYTDPAAVSLSGGSATRDLNFKIAGETPVSTVTDNTNNAILSYNGALPTVIAGAYVKMQILLPNETAAPGTSTGKVTSGVYSATSGSNVAIRVNAVDANWNVVNSNNLIAITSNDAAAVTPPASNLVNGTKIFNITVNTATTSSVITASDDSSPIKTVNTSNFTVILGSFRKLLVVYPGESLDPGSPSGKSGLPSEPVAGIAYNVTAYAMDDNWNNVVTATDNVAIQIANVDNFVAPAGKNLVAGKASFTLTFNKAGETPVITAKNQTNPTVTNYNASLPTVVAGAFTKLVMILPGESFSQGIAAGKTGAPNNAVAGNSFQVVVRAVDAVGNLVNSAIDVVGITSNDVNANMPSNVALANGEATFNISLVTAISSATRTLTSVNVTDGLKTSSTSPGFSVAAGEYAKLLVLLPNQNIAPGTVTGKTGNPIIPARGKSFQIRVRAVDQFYNPTDAITNSISTSSSDAGATISPALTDLVTGGYKFINVNIFSAGNQTVTVKDNVHVPVIQETIIVPNPTTASVASDYFRSVASGIWNNSQIWETSSNGISNWSPATLSPTVNASKITILNGHTVAITSNISSIDDVEVQSGGTLIVQTSTALSGQGIIIKGTLIHKTGLNITNGKLTIENGGKYVHDIGNSSTAIPSGANMIWNTGSICEVVGYTSFASTINGTAQTFSDFIWNDPGQNVSTGPILQSGFSARDFKVISTGSGALNLTSPGGTLIIRRNFEIQGGTVNILKANGDGTLYVGGNFNISGGALKAGTGTGTRTLVFNGGSTQNFTKTGGSFEGLNFSVANNAIVDFGTSVIDGTTGNFTMGTGATLITAHARGFTATGNLNGTLQNTGTKTYGLGNFIYNGGVSQQTGDGLPSIINNLTVNNNQGVVLSTSSVNYTINGQISIGPGSLASLNLGTNVLAGSFTDIGAGKLITRAGTGVPAGRTWTVGVEYAGTIAQNILSGTYNGAFITSGGGVKTGPSGTLNISSSWLSSGGRINLDNTDLVFNGNNQNITDQGSDSGNGLAFKNVRFTNGSIKTLSSGNFSVKTNGILTVDANTELKTNGLLNLKSAASGSATIASLPATAKITGSVRVERFISGGSVDPYRTYRLLSSPVYDNTASFINTNSYGNRTYSFNQYIDDMWLTGITSTAGGFDEPLSTAGSIWKYTSDFEPINNINESENIGRGTYLFYRGDRINNLTNKTQKPFADPESIVMDYKGVLNQGSITVPLTYYAAAGGFNLLGNPYAATIDWNSGGLDKSGLINNSVRHYNPVEKKYAVYDGDTNTGINGASRYILSGEGFFVESKTSGGNFTFNESAKVNSHSSIPLMMAVDNPVSMVSGSSGKLSVASTGLFSEALPVLKIKLSNNDRTIDDETAVLFMKGRKAEYDGVEDIRFMPGDRQGLALYTSSIDGIALAINKMPDVSELNKPIQLTLKQTLKENNFVLELNPSNIPSGYVLQLNDKLLNKAVPLRGNTTYKFTVDAGTNEELINDRFSISTVYGESLAETTKILNAAKSKVGVDMNAQKGLNLYPNPVQADFTLKYSGALVSDVYTVKIIGLSGQILLTKNIKAKELTEGHSINITGYTAGTYIAEIYDAKGGKRLAASKFIKL
ncbi:T9SS type A sorting domain-containing protein [Pedobacter montanisoli]|uniref:T9SS type A sorting domain-containing protein n=1 Tax=Pedobacter montanisoli TaxID=2923277 RepID=A0ABS9ZST5_9SPHI|nr:T9SS type A sorting domain-containing protein [Pedobacter montanisoli]MCJ0741432.1 T9SS type A sorting domain-containing protein [Pedobacter montanisoli]